MRSPGHGMEAWTLSEHWDLAFSFDPNRIPNQYALVGESDGSSTATAMPIGPAWAGCRIRAALKPASAGEYGVSFRHESGSAEFVGIRLADDGTATALIDEQELPVTTGRFRLHQWHECVVERWACVTRIIIDGSVVAETTNAPTTPVKPSLAIARGEAVFDDVHIVEIPWAGEFGSDAETRLPWRMPAEGWFRPHPEDKESEWCLMGETGAIQLKHPDYRVRELLLTTADTKVATPRTTVSALDAEQVKIDVRKPTYYHRIAIRFSAPEPARIVTFGPYHFSEDKIEDPSDYLDFTPEEYEAMKKSGEWDRDRREPKFRPLVGRSADDAVWVRKQGKCRVRDGVLQFDRRGASIVHCRDVIGPFELGVRVNLNSESELFVRPYGGESGVCISTKAREAEGSLHIEPNEWHTIVIKVSPEQAEILEPTGTSAVALEPQLTGDLVIIASGGGAIDDVTLRLPAGNTEDGLYEFADRETNWWRQGDTWMDHGGISCTLSSSWVTLVSENDAHAMLWHKSSFSSDVAIGTYLQEFSEWYGWKSRPSHVHEPYDNIILCFGTEMDDNTGYRLEINSRNRQETVLYRNGEEVASVDQNHTFPMRYVGGHEPFNPRTNHVRLVKSGNTVTALVNNVSVIRYEDPEPLDVSRVGLGGYRTHVNFSHIEVRRLKQ
jgi:hypothetical protein